MDRIIETAIEGEDETEMEGEDGIEMKIQREGEGEGENEEERTGATRGGRDEQASESSSKERPKWTGSMNVMKRMKEMNAILAVHQGDEDVINQGQGQDQQQQYQKQTQESEDKRNEATGHERHGMGISSKVKEGTKGDKEEKEEIEEGTCRGTMKGGMRVIGRSSSSTQAGTDHALSASGLGGTSVKTEVLSGLRIRYSLFDF